MSYLFYHLISVRSSPMNLLVLRLLTTYNLIRDITFFLYLQNSRTPFPTLKSQNKEVDLKRNDPLQI